MAVTWRCIVSGIIRCVWTRWNSVDRCAVIVQVLFTLTPEEISSNFVGAIVSSRGKYVYGLTEDNHLCCFSLEEHRLVAATKVWVCQRREQSCACVQVGDDCGCCDQAVEPDALGLAYHPHLNLVATYSGVGVLRTWSA